MLTVRELVNVFEEISKYVELRDSAEVLGNAYRDGKYLVGEGAQGTLLDIDYGTYPYVTSSSTTVGGVLTGAGLPLKALSEAEIIGVSKAYTTRVGNGPFPTELGGKKSEEFCNLHNRQEEFRLYPNPSPLDPNPLIQGIALRRAGGEYGTTTGRLRRCGWLDLSLLKYSVQINSLTGIAITKLDVLTGFQPKICAKRSREITAVEVVHFDKFTSVYEEFGSWTENLQKVRVFKDLPKAIKCYIERIEGFVGVPVRFIGVGPREDQIIVREL